MSLFPTIHDECKDCFYKRMYKLHEQLMDKFFRGKDKTIMTFKARMGIICTRAAALSKFLNQPSQAGLTGVDPIKQENYPTIKEAVEKEIEEIKHQLRLMQQTSDTAEDLSYLDNVGNM